jgi:perosamine synthetase
MIPVNRPLITSEDVAEVSNSLQNTLISGESPPVAKLELALANYLGAKHAVAVSNGTTAIDLSVHSLNLQEDDEVVLPAFTIVSTVSELIRKKVTLKLVDADPSSWSMNSEIAAELITSKTKLVIPVHIYGLATDMEPLLSVTSNLDTFILEDSAEALGLEQNGRKIGTFGNASTFSFYANKIVTGGEGGAVVSNDDDFIRKIRYYRNLCFEPTNRFVHSEIGWNSRISGLSAALAASQMLRLDNLVTLKREIGDRYRKGLSDHPWFQFMPAEHAGTVNSVWVFAMLLKEDCPLDALQFQNELRVAGVETRRFFCPIHLQPIARKMNFELAGSMKVSENLWERGIYLPSGLGNTVDEIDKVIEKCWEMLKRYG